MEDGRETMLRELIARLEAAPRSERRDRLLKEARERVVTHETGLVCQSAWDAYGPASDSPSLADQLGSLGD